MNSRELEDLHYSCYLQVNRQEAHLDLCSLQLYTRFTDVKPYLDSYRWRFSDAGQFTVSTGFVASMLRQCQWEQSY